MRKCLTIPLAALAFVATSGETLVNPQVPPPGHSPAFKDGYVDGCLTGFQDAGRDGYQSAGRKDEKRYLGDKDYAAGFAQGDHACYEEELRTPKIIMGGRHR